MQLQQLPSELIERILSMRNVAKLRAALRLPMDRSHRMGRQVPLEEAETALLHRAVRIVYEHMNHLEHMVNIQEGTRTPEGDEPLNRDDVDSILIYNTQNPKERMRVRYEFARKPGFWPRNIPWQQFFTGAFLVSGKQAYCDKRKALDLVTEFCLKLQSNPQFRHPGAIFKDTLQSSILVKLDMHTRLQTPRYTQR